MRGKVRLTVWHECDCCEQTWQRLARALAWCSHGYGILGSVPSARAQRLQRGRLRGYRAALAMLTSISGKARTLTRTLAGALPLEETGRLRPPPPLPPAAEEDATADMVSCFGAASEILERCLVDARERRERTAHANSWETSSSCSVSARNQLVRPSDVNLPVVRK